MLPISHPDATAFAARFLADPADRLGRLVFADWLEERGDDSSLAWADYIRTQAELETLRWNDPRGVELTRSAVATAQRVRATLTFEFKGIERLKALPKLLPPHRCFPNWWDGWDDPSGREVVPRSLAEEHGLLPLYAVGKTVYLAGARAADQRLQDLLTRVLNANVCLFGYKPTVTPGDIEWVYTCTGPMPTPVAARWTSAAVQPDEGPTPLNALLDEMLSAGISEVSFDRDRDGVRVSYLTAWGWRERDPMTEEQLLQQLGCIRGKLEGSDLPAFPHRLEFWHDWCGRSILARGGLCRIGFGTRLWFSLLVTGRLVTRGPG